MNNKPVESGEDEGEQGATQTNTNPRRQGNRSGRGHKTPNGFRGETPGMQGHVFRLQSEHSKKREFQDTMDALERYAGRIYPLDTAKLQDLFKKLELPTYTQPIPPGTAREKQLEGVKIEEVGSAIDEWSKIKYTEEFKLYLSNQERLESTLIAIFNVAWGQCSRKLQDQIRAEKNFETIEKTSNVADLLKLIKVTCMKFEANVCLEEALWEAKHRFFTYRQGDFESTSVHIRNVRALYEVVEHYGGSVFDDPSLLKAEEDKDMNQGVFTRSNEELKSVVKMKNLHC